ncbi:hypothetical protein UlMin_035417 [Ulmus minor]
MSRITKWKLEKTKVKVVFRLQFHATHIPQTGWDKLFISFIPADSGKATAKTTKANVRSGTCKWADPIYESTRLLQDIKTKQYDEKFYKLVVAMGSSRASVLGEAHIDLAHYADALKPYVVALPLQGCDSGAILHVTVQLLTSKTGFREFEQQRELRERVFQTTSDESASRKISSLEDTITDPIDKVNARVRFKEGLPPLEEVVGLNEESADSAVGFDGSSSTSDSLYAEKHDTYNTHEVDSLKSITCGDLVGPSHSQSSHPEKVDPSNHRLLPQGSNDWPHGWGSDYSGDNDLANAYEENGRLRRSLEVAESSILELKQEVSSLQSHADEIGSEAQKFSQLLAAEIASGEELAKEVSVMRSECSNFKADLEQLKYSKQSTGFAMRGAIKTDRDRVSQELQQRWLKGLLDMEDKIRELQKNACFGFHERDVRSFNSDLEELLGVLQDLKQGTGQEVSGVNSVSFKENRGMTVHKDEQLLPGARFNAELYEPESLLLGLNIPPLVSQDNDSADVHGVLKEKIFVLVKELDDLKGEREGLARKMDQMECYYEALVQELEETQRQMMGELQSLRSEHSTSLYTISATKAEMEKMHQDMNNQIIRFAEEKSDLDSLNKVLERRAATAEAALKRARLNYSIAVKQLQKDLEVLSFQILNMYETNENLIKQAFSDSLLPRFPSQEQNTQNHKLDSKELHVAEQLSKCENVSEAVKKHSERDIISEDLKRSLLLQKGLRKKSEEEIVEVYLVNVYLDVFSKALQETLLEASADFKELREKNNELTQQLELSNESKELLVLKLQTAMDEIHHLSQYKDTCEAKCNDLVLQNQVLETNFQNVTRENSLFSDKITECEALLEDLRSYENKFKACTEEKIELEKLLKNKTLESEDLQNKVQDEINAVRTEFDGLASSKENLQSSVNFLHDKLQNLLAFYDTKCKGLSIWSEDIFHGLESQDLAGIMLRLEELQHGACEMMFQLIKEKRDLLHEREMAQMSLDVAESDNVVMKQKFERDIQNILDKLDGSSILVQKLQSEVEAIANRLNISFEAEENYAQQHRELLSDFDLLEIKLQQLTSQNMDLAREITALDSVSEELSRCKLAIAALSEEKEALMINLNGKIEEAAKLEVELNNLRSSSESELLVERSIRDKLESKVTDLAQEKEVLDTGSEELRKCKLAIVALSEEKEALLISLKDKSEESAKLEEELNTLRSSSQSSRDELQVERGIRDELESKVTDLAREKAALDTVSEELRKCKLAIAALSEEKEALVISLKDKSEEHAKLEEELNTLRSSSQSSCDELQVERGIRDELESKVTDLAREKAALDTVSEELRKCKLAIAALSEEKEALLISLNDKSEESAKLEEELDTLRSSSQSFRDELQVERGIRDELESKVTDFAREKAAMDTVIVELRKCKLAIAALSEEKEALLISLNDKSEESAKLEEELDTLRSSSQSFCDELQVERGIRDELESKVTDFAREKAAMDTVIEELRKCKLAIAALSEEKEALVISLKDKREESAKLEEELNVLRSSSQSFCDQLQVERGIRDELESKVTALTSQLNEKHHELLKFDQQQAELVHLKQFLSNLELEKSQVSRTLLDSERSLEAVREECSSISCLEAQLSEMHELSVASDVRLTFVQTQYDAWIEELVKQLFSSDRHLTELQKKYANVESMLTSCRASEVHYIEENAKLMTSLNFLKSDLDASIAQNRVLLDKNSGMRTELEECKKRSDMEATFDMDKRKHVLEVEKMEGLLVKSEEKIDNLIFSKEELEVQLLVLKEKLDEQQPQIVLLEEYKHELKTLQNKYNELTHRLSEQVLKTEEFKNLSIHLKELKDKADAKCLQAREKRESEGSPSPMQESLRIAFIKEQYETKLQELKHQLAISKKHSEEMLWKLQDAIDEVENKKKSEASHLKRNEELGMRILELESELQSAVSEKRELMKAYDLMKAEKECSSISLECCKEEKQKVEASLRKCNEEKSKIALELDLMKDLLESSESALQNQRRDDDGLHRVDFREVEPVYLSPINEANHSNALINMQTNEDALVSGTLNGCPSQEDVPQGEMKHLALVNDHFKAQSLRSSMDHLHKELERMKHEDDQQFGLSSPDLEGELMQLHRVNEELGSIFPLFNEFPCNGNALERVLALEIELAEALQAKKKSSVLFQSSFLKQHSDEEAVFKSFRDINELIKDMLELKGRYSLVDTELKEMHDRYSQLSLQFAEVEGERQKLIMTLKNVRGSKKTPYLNRSSTAPMGGPLS